MLFLNGFVWLLACQCAGELLARSVGLALPGPVLGMLILVGLLQLPAVRQAVGTAADALLAHLSLLFVPVGVGVIVHLGLVSQYGVRLLAVVVCSTLLGMATTGWLLGRMWPREG